MAAIIIVFELPPNDSDNKFVSSEFLKGTNSYLPPPPAEFLASA